MILVVADDPKCLRTMEASLAPREQILVRRSSAALAAAKRLRKSVHLAMVDFDLPGVLEELVRECPNLPVVVFNGTVQRHAVEIAKSTVMA